MSAGEIILIFIVYLLLFGAKGLPSLAQTLGKAVYQFRNAAGEVQREIMNGVNEVKKNAEIKLDQQDTDTTAQRQSFPPPSPDPSEGKEEERQN